MSWLLLFFYPAVDWLMLRPTSRAEILPNGLRVDNEIAFLIQITLTAAHTFLPRLLMAFITRADPYMASTMPGNFLGKFCSSLPATLLVIMVIFNTFLVVRVARILLQKRIQRLSMMRNGRVSVLLSIGALAVSIFALRSTYLGDQVWLFAILFCLWSASALHTVWMGFLAFRLTKPDKTPPMLRLLMAVCGILLSLSLLQVIHLASVNINYGH
jgi:hypothetical protein